MTARDGRGVLLLSHKHVARYWGRAGVSWHVRTKELSVPCIGNNTYVLVYWCEEGPTRRFRAKCEGEGRLPGRRGRTARSFTGGDHT